MRKGPFTLIHSKRIYKNPWIEVKEETVRTQQGEEKVFGIVDYVPGISVVALNKAKEIYLVKEYYYVLDTYGIQLPSGGIDDNETPVDAAKRELHEETGITADTWQSLGRTDPLTMIIKTPAYLFLATDIAQSRKIDDEVEVLTIPFDEAYSMVMDSKITHAQSCIAILKTKILLDEKKISI